jgi:hypothetical protein
VDIIKETIFMKSIAIKTLLVVALIGGIITLGDAFMNNPHTSELAFAEFSKDKSLMGSMVPASCSSSAAPNPQPLYIDYNPYGYLETYDLWHTENYVANCVCGNGATNFPACSVQVTLNMAPPSNPRITSFTGPTIATYNTKPLLSWSSTETGYCISNWLGASVRLPSTGSGYGATLRGTPITHTLTCVGSDGYTPSAPSSIVVGSTPQPPAPPRLPACFIAGTNVTMGDGLIRDIETVDAGEMIMTSTGPNKITKAFRIPYKGELYAFNGSGNYFVTPAHAFRTLEGWKSFDPEGTRKEVPGIEVSLLKVGDVLLREDGGSTVLESFDTKYTETTVYSFSIDGTRDYYADGYWVHNLKMLQ